MIETKNEAELAIQEVMDNLPARINVNELYNQFIGLTHIEKVHEEDYVMRELLKGKTRGEIIGVLKAKYPDTPFSYADIDKFMARNQEIVKAMGKEVTLTARRHLEAKAQCSEMIAGLALYTQKLIQDFRSEGDNTNTVAAIRALNTTMETYMKLEGMIGTQAEGGKVINVINTLSENKASLRDRMHNANFIELKEGDE